MLKVIGAGFGRTGTASLKTALEHLGIGPCYHMFDCIAEPHRFRHWDQALDGEPVDWEEVFEGFEATVDWPGTACWRQIVERYPDAKVILTTRDPEAWYESTYNTIFQIGQRDEAPPGMDPEIWSGVMKPVIHKMIWNGTFDGRFADKDYAMRVFTEHNDEVQRSVPADRLLVFQAREGWAPLCEFLGAPIPSEPYPRINDTQSMPETIKRVLSGQGLPTVGAH